MPIFCTKTVYDPPEANDGCRLIIMRRYPRGIAKWKANAWLPALAPSLPLVHWYHDSLNSIRDAWGKTDPERCQQEIAKFWKTYTKRYLTEMKAQRTNIEFLASLHRDFAVSFTLLCACPDHKICHRSLLSDLINEVPPRTPKPAQK